MTLELPAAVSGERFECTSLAGRLDVYVAGQGPPLLLIHSINASASAAEMRPLHEHYRAIRTVFSIDLPGYGFSPELRWRVEDHRGDPGAAGDREDPHAPGSAGQGAAKGASPWAAAASGLTFPTQHVSGGQVPKAAASSFATPRRRCPALPACGS